MNYLIDTNVLSEARRGTATAMAWFQLIEPQQAFISVVSLGEVMKGIETQLTRQPALARRLLLWLDTLHAEYADRILPITLDVALAWGRIAAGRTRGMPDALLGATAIVHNLTLVTRSIRDFRDLPIRVVDPWAS